MLQMIIENGPKIYLIRDREGTLPSYAADQCRAAVMVDIFPEGKGYRVGRDPSGTRGPGLLLLSGPIYTQGNKGKG
jgi:hypothetical protein